MTRRERLAIRVAPEPYDVVLGAGLLADLGDLAAEVVRPARVVVVTDDGVAATEHVATATVSLADAGFDPEVTVVPSGDGTKSVAHAELLWSELAAAGIDRDGCVFALGGGMVGDLAGFVASTWMRGVPCIQVPTTTLAMADASVGGKTAINLSCGKNQVGTFHQPRLVVADVETLATLPQRDLVAGYAEVVKCAVLSERDALTTLRAQAPQLVGGEASAVVPALALAIRVKEHHVRDDPHERGGSRILLNLGHTAAHALETERGHGNLRHGEAVAIGLVVAAHVALARGLADETLVAALRNTLAALTLPTEVPADIDRDALLRHARHDKKRTAGELRMVLPLGTGGAGVFTVDDEELRAALDAAT